MKELSNVHPLSELLISKNSSRKNMDSILKIGDKVRVGDKIGEAIRLEQRATSTIIKVAFEEGPAKDFVCPPTKVEKILSPIFAFHRHHYSPSPFNCSGVLSSLKPCPCPFPVSASLHRIRVPAYRRAGVIRIACP